MPISKLDRTVLRLSGEGVKDWLSGLITNNLDSDLNFAALLTPQGKIIADFFVFSDGHDWLIDTASKFQDGLTKRLTMYKLRAPINITVTDLSVYAAWNGSGDEGYADPRHPSLGRRIYASDLISEHSAQDYDLHRLALGIPDSQHDFATSDVFPANANMDLIAGVDFKKGCFVGQEVVSRMQRKTEVKKRMRGFSFDGALLDTAITQAGRTIGEIMHSYQNYGMAMIRQDRLAEDNIAIMVGEIEIKLLDIPHGNQAK